MHRKQTFALFLWLYKGFALEMKSDDEERASQSLDDAPSVGFVLAAVAPPARTS
jgi:hypothetical protein